MLTMIDYLIGVGLGTMCAFYYVYKDMIWSRIYFYYRIISVMITCILQYFSAEYGAALDTPDYKSSFFVDILIELTKTDVIFVKVLQAISFNGNFIDENVHDRITQFSDNVPYDIFDIDHNVTMRVLKETPLTFIDRPALPIRSGMISLVYAMQDKKTEKKYILKVKRKNIDNRVNKSIDNMMGLVYVLSVIFKWWFNLDVVDVVSRHLDLLREQLDFSQEEKNTLEAREDMVDIDYLRIPELYKCNCLSGRAIIMEHLPGEHINNVPESDKEIYRDLIFKYFFASSMIYHKFHGDLHSGNILCIDNGPVSELDIVTGKLRYQLGVIDFGIVMHFPKTIPDTLFYMFEHQCNKEMLDSITRMYINNLIYPPNLLNLLDEDVSAKIVDDISHIAQFVFFEGNMVDQSHFYRIFRCISDNISYKDVTKHDIKMSDGLVKLEVAVSMCVSLVKHLTPEDPNKHMKRVFDEMFHCDIMFSK